MAKEREGLRASIASVLAAAVSCATLFGLARYLGMPWLSPGALFATWTGGHAIGSWVLYGAVAAAFVLMYAAWFDELLRGNAAVRGLKFGALAWAWSLLTLSVVQGHGVAGLRAPRPWLYLGATLATWLLSGLVAGLVYGVGREYDDYRWGLGYGVPDRRSLG